MKDPIPKLDYALPQRANIASPVLFGVFGILIGLFGGQMLVMGCTGIYFTRQHPNFVTYQSDMTDAVIFLVLGLFCEGIAIRWCIGVFRRRAG